MRLINTPKNTQDRANKEYSENCRESSENCRFNNLENKFCLFGKHDENRKKLVKS